MPALRVDIGCRLHTAPGQNRGIGIPSNCGPSRAVVYSGDRTWVKRKPTTRNDTPVISKELLERARKAIETEMDTIQRVHKCSVCGSECAPNAVEPLCWVC